MRAALKEPFRVHVVAATGEFQPFASELEERIRGELRQYRCALAGPDGPGLEILVTITHIAPGASWGETAECHVDVAWTAGGILAVGFKAIGSSDSTWVRDRIPTALATAAAAVANRISASRP